MTNSLALHKQSRQRRKLLPSLLHSAGDLQEMIKLLLIYGHELSHCALRDLLRADDTLHLAHEAAEVSAVLPRLRQQAFDIILLDVSAPEKNGLEAFCDLKQAAPHIPILIINGSDHSDRMNNFVRLGCKGYLSYTTPSEQVIPAIQSIARGETYVRPQHAPVTTRNTPILHERLSLRELQVFFKLIKGQSVNSVAEELEIAPGSVSVFRSKILKKMNVHNNAALIHYALAHHLIS